MYYSVTLVGRRYLISHPPRLRSPLLSQRDGLTWWADRAGEKRIEKNWICIEWRANKMSRIISNYGEATISLNLVQM